MPAKFCQDCHKFLDKSYFHSDPKVKVGTISWEDLLPLMHDRILEIVIDSIMKETDGLKHLREWQKRRPSQAPA